MLSPIRTLAETAGRAIMEYYGRPIPVDRKADDSPLTQADLASHRIIVAGLREAFPDIPVVSEEDGERESGIGRAERYWLVDPLDGTKEFVKQTGSFTVNIALVEQGMPVLGVIFAPATGLSYWAAKGEGAWKQAAGEPAERIAAQRPSAPFRFVASKDHAGPAVAALLARYPDSTCLSIGSSLKFCLVAEGAADAYLRDVPTMEWDTAAAHAIVNEAGAVLLDFTTKAPLAYGKSEWRNGPIVTLAPQATDAGLAI